MHAHRRRLEVLALVGVALDDAHASGLLALLFQKLVHLVRELLAHARIQRDVAVGRVLPEKFVPHPPAGHAQRDRQVIRLDDFEQRVEDFSLLRRAHHLRVGQHRHHHAPLQLHRTFVRDVAREIRD